MRSRSRATTAGDEGEILIVTCFGDALQLLYGYETRINKGE